MRRRIHFVRTRKRIQPTRASSSARRSAALCASLACTMERARRSSSTTAAIARTTWSISTPQCPAQRLRAGDLSSLSISPIDPITGMPFPGGQIPQSRLDPSAVALLQFFPLPNLPGATQNYRRSVAALSTSDQFNARVTHNFSGTPGRRGGAGGGGRGAGFGRGGGARGGRSGTAVVLNAQLQYRRNLADVVNVFPLLGGTNNGSTWSVPVSLNILRGRSIHNLQFTATRSSTAIRNGFAGAIDVASYAGINGVSTDPSQWGVPNLSFASLTGLRDVAPDDRSDRRIQIGYTMTHPLRATFRAGGDARLDRSGGITTGDARGSYVFTGLYSAASPVIRSYGLDFADFLLGLPQQASVQYRRRCGVEWTCVQRVRAGRLARARKSDVEPRRTVRGRESYTEAHNRMVNLDVAPGFTAAEPVVSGRYRSVHRTIPFESHQRRLQQPGAARRRRVAGESSHRRSWGIRHRASTTAHTRRSRVS